MLAEVVAGLIGIDLVEKLKEPAKKAFGWLFEKGRNKYDEHKLDQALNNLSDKITKVTKVKTIYKGDDSIDLHEFYVPTRIEGVDVFINFITDISNQSIVLEGTVGQGKSIFMRYLTAQEAKQGQRIPLFYELRRLDDNDTLTNALSKQINNWIAEFRESDFDRVAKTGSLVLFLDGFDEIPHNKIKKLLNEIEEWCERYPNMQIIVSSRPDADIQQSNYLRVFKLSEYRFYEQSLLIDKLVEECESNNLLKKSIENSSTEIQGLLKTPLMVTLFVMNYRGSLEIPSNQHEFYKNLFGILISRHDKTKPGFKREVNSGLNEVELQEVFEEFCFITFSIDILVFDDAEAIKIIKECLDNQNLNDNPTMVLRDLSKNVCLVLKDGLDYTFIHKSIQEFYYASFIYNQPEIKTEFYNDCSYSFVQGKQNILHFLESMDTYYFYKYFSLPIFNIYIEHFSLNEGSNKLVESLFYKEDSRERIVIEFRFSIFKDYPFYYFDMLHNDLAKTLIYDVPSEHYFSKFRFVRNISLEVVQPIEKLYTEVMYREIKTEFHRVRSNILRHREDMMRFISKKDARKYRKYLSK